MASRLFCLQTDFQRLPTAPGSPAPSLHEVRLALNKSRNNIFILQKTTLSERVFSKTAHFSVAVLEKFWKRRGFGRGDPSFKRGPLSQGLSPSQGLSLSQGLSINPARSLFSPLRIHRENRGALRSRECYRCGYGSFRPF